MKYKPKRAPKKYLDGAPDYILSCHDSGPDNGADRYIVFMCGSLASESLDSAAGPGLHRVPFLGVSPDLDVSMWGDMTAAQRAELARREGHIAWLDIPKRVRNHIAARCK